MSLLKFLGCNFGEGQPHYRSIQLEGVERAIADAQTIGADGIEVRTQGKINEIGRQRSYLKTWAPGKVPRRYERDTGPTIEEFGSAIETITDAELKVNWHMSRHGLALFEEAYYNTDFLAQFERIIGHVSYEENILLLLDDLWHTGMTQSPLESRMETYSEEEPITPKLLRGKIVLENGAERGKSLLNITEIVEQARLFQLNKCVDVASWFKAIQTGADKLDNYKRDETVRTCGADINWAHVHGMRQEHEGESFVRHLPWDKKTIFKRKPREMLQKILKYSNIEGYTIEVWKGKPTIADLERTAYNAERLLNK